LGGDNLDKNRSVYILLFGALIVAGFLIINYNDPAFKNAGYIYIGLIVAAFAIYYFGPKLLGRR
jgi:hypothetical protein